MDLLKAAMSGTKRKNESVKANQRKYARRGDDNQTQNNVTGLTDNNVDSGKIDNGSEDHINNSLNPGDDHPDIGSKDHSNNINDVNTIKQKLRLLGVPITLFGETDEDRSKRLEQITKEAVDSSSNSHIQNNYHFEQKNLREAEEKEKRILYKETLTKVREERYKQDKFLSDFSHEQEYIFFCLKKWMYLWEKASEYDVEESQLYKETRDGLIPLFKLLKAKELKDDVMKHLLPIVKHTQNKKYRDAQHSYFELSIGNQAWPIGVTMVGIHERAGRERIAKSNIDHLLNDEVIHKYVLCIYRLLTFMQKTFPTNPSDMF